ncbi:MAG TPA: ferritin family protein [Smithellaceae bacterium]|nr:ferritin family protein [Smithellaceae bacterium]HPE07942.1 ferritin family protein [Smithellaceae bacterium]HRY38429.1 ferritin family protein [Smithellaceae bacterium]
MNLFTASEVVEFAERIHENGANFYRYAIQLVQNQEAKDLFAELAEEEGKYHNTLGKIFAGMEKSIPEETYVGEYAQYLRNYIDNNIVFTQQAINDDLAAVKDACSAIDFAARRELDSISYYENIKRLVPKIQHESIDHLIAEERDHFVRLTNLKKCML